MPTPERWRDRSPENPLTTAEDVDPADEDLTDYFVKEPYDLQGLSGRPAVVTSTGYRRVINPDEPSSYQRGIDMNPAGEIPKRTNSTMEKQTLVLEYMPQEAGSQTQAPNTYLTSQSKWTRGTHTETNMTSLQSHGKAPHATNDAFRLNTVVPRESAGILNKPPVQSHFQVESQDPDLERLEVGSSTT